MKFRQNIFMVFLFTMVSVCIASHDSSMTKSGMISLTGGVSKPIGYFALRDGSEHAGHAIAGKSFDLIIDNKLQKRTGISVELHLQTNPMDIGYVLNELSYEYPSINWRSRTLPYITTGFFIGVFGSLPMDKDEIFEISFKGLIGYVNATSSEIAISASDDFESSTIIVKQAEKYTLAGSIGVGIQYNLTENFSILMNLKYLRTNPIWNVEIIYDGNSEIVSSNQVIETLNLGFGAGCRF